MTGDARARDDNGALWAVVVIHGVGDTGPGVTLEALLPTLHRAGNRLAEIAQPETRMLPEPEGRLPPKIPEAPLSPAATSSRPLSDRFPVHIRRFKVKSPRHGDPARAAFAEVYWADLSTAGEGMLRLLLRLFTAIFNLRYIPYVAAAGPDIYLARWLRYAMDAISWLLCGPAAGLTAFMLYLLTLRAFVPVTREHLAVVIADVAGAALAFGLNRVRARRKWREHWSFVINWIAVAGLISAALTIARPADSFSSAIALLLDISYDVFALAGGLIVIGFAVWIAGRIEAMVRGNTTAGPALDAAVAATMLQIGLWVVVVPAVGAALLKGWSPSLYSSDESWFVTVKSSFAQNVALCGIVAASGAAVALWRWLEVKFRSRPPARLIVNDVIVAAIFAASLAGTIASVYAWATGAPRFDHWLSGARDTIFGISLFVIAAVGAVFAKGLGNALHILMDIVGHFYTDRMTVPNPFRKPRPPDLNHFTIQQQLEARFRAVLDEVLQLGTVRNLTVVAHSQGTMIALDVLWLEWAARRLAGIDVRLVTMGSPFTHLYQHYFPDRYPPLFNPDGTLSSDWGTDLTKTVRSWVNIYRVDDFVGTTIAGNDARSFPDNVCIHPGGHTGYWRDDAAVAAMSGYLPGRK